MPETRKLDPDTFLFLAISAEAFGGIGAGVFADVDDTPRCAHGLCGIGTNKALTFFGEAMELRKSLLKAGISPGVNDHAVKKINARAGIVTTPGDSLIFLPRVPFEAWAEELNIEVAGDA